MGTTMQPRGQRPTQGQGNRQHRIFPGPGAVYTSSFAPPPPNNRDHQEAESKPMRYTIPEFSTTFAKIKVIGVGGAGGNAINRMVDAGVDGIEFVAVNTDAQALLTSQAPIAVRIGDKLTKGLGAGGRPEVGARAAEESADSIAELMRGTD